MEQMTHWLCFIPVAFVILCFVMCLPYPAEEKQDNVWTQGDLEKTGLWHDGKEWRIDGQRSEGD